MPTFNAMRDSFTPAAFSISSAPNWCLDAVGTGVFGKVIMFTWGGSLTTLRTLCCEVLPQGNIFG